MGRRWSKSRHWESADGGRVFEDVTFEFEVRGLGEVNR